MCAADLKLVFSALSGPLFSGNPELGKRQMSIRDPKGSKRPRASSESPSNYNHFVNFLPPDTAKKLEILLVHGRACIFDMSPFP